MPGPEKRIPGQSNADYERAPSDPNARFLGTHSLQGGGDLTGLTKVGKALFDWWKRRNR